MLARLRVEGDVGGAGLGEVGDDPVHGLDHQVDVDGGGDPMLAQGLADQGADGQVGDIVVVHDVEVDDVRPGGEDVVHLFPEFGEVGGEDRGGNEVFNHGGLPVRALGGFGSAADPNRSVRASVWPIHKGQNFNPIGVGFHPERQPDADQAVCAEVKGALPYFPLRYCSSLKE